MLKFLFKKITGKEEPKEPAKADKLATEIQDKSGKLMDILSEKLTESIEEVGIMREKSKNLEATNFNLGRLHLEKGNLREATFRFYLMTKFFPKNLDAKYELAYCYALKEKYAKSQKILEDLLDQQPDYSKRARKLLDHVRLLQQNQ